MQGTVSTRLAGRIVSGRTTRKTTRQRIDVERLLRRCESQKIAYETLADAETAVEESMEKGYVHPGCHLIAYACDRCGRFHVANRHIVFPDEQPISDAARQYREDIRASRRKRMERPLRVGLFDGVKLD